MPSSARQDSDNLAWDLCDDRQAAALRQVRLSSRCRKIEGLAAKVFKKSATFVSPLVVGGFNVLYPMRIDDFPDVVLIRLPLPHLSVFPQQKMLAEAATLECVQQNTQLPVPKLFLCGIDPEFGPFMAIQDLVSRRCMSRALEAPRNPDDAPTLNPDIDEHKLLSLYTKLARCVSQLVQPTFPRIGSLQVVDASPGRRIEVMGRPMTLNMANMVQLSNIPKSIFPPKDTTFQTADAWYVALADMQMATLVFQHNDMVSSEDDCRNKYVARQIFRRLARQGSLSTFSFTEDNWSAYAKARSGSLRPTFPCPTGSGSFRLYSEDFRPANIIINDNDDILGVIDWEFYHAAPTQFALDPPWWLLLEMPEMWEPSIDDWASIYDRRLKTWLSAMEAAERDTAPGSLLLSDYMRDSWETGRFWLNYAARKSWSFDTIYWKYLDERFFGERGREDETPLEPLWKTRVHLLTVEERDAMERLVQTKMEEAKERMLGDWDDDEARRHLRTFLFD